ncbi:MAG: virulence factor [Pseudoflavonifractor sp.]
MYAIAFDLDTDTLGKTYGVPSSNNAYTDIKNVLFEYGFSRQQGSVYLGETADAVKAVMATQMLAKKFSWFAPSVRDIRMLRIEDNNDLMPAINMVIGT